MFPVDSLIVENNEIKGLKLSDGKTVMANYVIVAPGREGADWLTKRI